MKSAEPEIISKPKRGHERRNLCITHPVPQSLLSYEIAHRWSKVHGWLVRQEFTLDKIVISEKFERGIDDINFDIHNAKKSFIEATADWLVKTDITRFYPSIYTHSVAWAAYGKERVKTSLSNYDGSLADRIDLLVRACNRNQTVGIPIGPETSRIVAEIISARIDSDFRGKMDNLPLQNIDRLQDDWFVGVDSLEKAERALSTISSVYRHYGLEINGSKTSVDRVVNVAEEEWISEIKAFLSHRGLKSKLKSKAISDIIESVPSSALALVLLDMDSKGLVAHKLPKAKWESLIDSETIRTDWSWLLSYEGIRHGWLRDSKSVMKDPFFAAMASRDVVFYDPKRNVMPSKKEILLRSIRKRKAALEAQKLMRSLRGFSEY